MVFWPVLGLSQLFVTLVTSSIGLRFLKFSKWMTSFVILTFFYRDNVYWAILDPFSPIVTHYDVTNGMEISKADITNMFYFGKWLYPVNVTSPRLFVFKKCFDILYLTVCVDRYIYEVYRRDVTAKYWKRHHWRTDWAIDLFFLKFITFKGFWDKNI